MRVVHGCDPSMVAPVKRADRVLGSGCIDLVDNR